MDGKMQWPRRRCIDQRTHEETLLWDAISSIDSLPFDTTSIVVALEEQAEKLADLLESQP